MGKMLFISNDAKLNSFLENFSESMKCEYAMFNKSNDPLNIISEVFSLNSSMLILDDDFISPNSEKLLESIKKVNSKLSVIFITSNTSLEFGRKITSIGVKFYIMKPFSEDEFEEFLRSAKKQLSENIY